VEGRAETEVGLSFPDKASGQEIFRFIHGLASQSLPLVFRATIRLMTTRTFKGNFPACFFPRSHEQDPLQTAHHIVTSCPLYTVARQLFPPLNTLSRSHAFRGKQSTRRVSQGQRITRMAAPQGIASGGPRIGCIITRDLKAVNFAVCHFVVHVLQITQVAPGAWAQDQTPIPNRARK
jgi:hypothetical protein